MFRVGIVILDAQHRRGLVHGCVETLASWIAREGALNELDAVGWIIRLAKGLEPIHALGVAHGSITAEAVRIEGSSRASRGFLVDARRLHDLVAYHSPERADGESISPANDTWAVAVTLYLALTGSLPFPGANDAEVKKRILGPAASPLAVFDVGDDGLQRVLDQAFSRDASRRLTKLRELRQALEEWHTDPTATKLPPLDDEGDKEDSSGAHRAMIEQAREPAGQGQGGVRDLVEDDDSATSVRSLSSFQEQLAAYKSQSPPPLVRTSSRSERPAAPPAPRTPPRLLARPEAPLGERRPPRMMKGGTVPLPSFPVVPAPRDPPPRPGSPPPGRAETAGNTLIDNDDGEDEPETAIMESPIATPMPPRPGESPRATAPIRPAALRSPATNVPATGVPATGVPASSAESFTTPAPWEAPRVEGVSAPQTPPSSRKPSPAAEETVPGMMAAQSTATFVEGHPSLVPPPLAEPTQASSLTVPLLAGFGLLIAGGAAAFFLFRPPSSDLAVPSATPSLALVAPSAPSARASVTSSAPSPAASATGTSASPSDTGSASPIAPSSAAPSAASAASPSASSSVAPSASVSASPSASPAAPTDANACLAPLFPPDTFMELPPSLGFVCTITDPRKGGGAVRTEVVRAGARKRVSDGMREWAVLGWYEMAAFAIMRSSCCPSAAPLDIPIAIPTCDIETPLLELATLASSAAAEDAKVTAALDAYTNAVRCVARAGGSDGFGQKGGPQGGESGTFEKTLKRVRAAAKKK